MTEKVDDGKLEQVSPSRPGLPEPTSSGPSSGERLLTGFGHFATLIGFAVMIAVFWIASPDIFPTWANIRTILETAAPIAILAVGLTVVLSSGDFDLSFTGLVVLVSGVSAEAMVNWHLGTVAAVAMGIATGILGGVIAGVLVAARRTSAFIATLALGTVWTGVALAITGGGTIITGLNHSFTDLTFKEALGIPMVAIYAVVICVFTYALMRWTVFGRQTFAIGSNRAVARLAGIRVGMTQIAAYAFNGLCAAVAAIILSSQTDQFSANIASGLFIPPYLASFFGISVLAAGKFNVFGTVVGALFVATLQTGLIIVGAESYVANIATGGALIVILFVASQSRAAR